jgi:hypothetical protein
MAKTKQVRVLTESAKCWMRQHVASHVDRVTGEVNHTALAEECACALDLYGPGPDYPIPEWVFEIALDILAPNE